MYKGNKIIILLTDQITTIVHVCDKRLLSRWEIKTDSASDILNLRNYIKENKDSTVHIVLNNTNQTYQHHYLNIPFVSNKSSFLLGLLPKKLQQEADLIDIRVFKSDKHQQHCLVIAAVLNVDWIRFTNSIASQFKGFALAPLEYSHIINVLSLGLVADNSRHRWDVVLVYNANSQAQVIVYYNNIFFKAEFLSCSKDDNVNVYTGYIKQAFDSSIAELKIANDHTVNIYIIAPNEIRNSLFAHDFSRKNLIIMSPYEASIMLSLDYLVNKEECYADLVIAYNILHHSNNNYTFHTKYFQNKRKGRIVNNITDSIVFCVIVLFTVFSFYMESSIYLQYIHHKELIERYNNIQSEMGDISCVAFDGGIDINRLKEIDRLVISQDYKALQYMLNTHKHYRSLIIQSSYDGVKNSCTHLPSIKISFKDKLHSEKYKAEYIPRSYVQVYYD